MNGYSIMCSACVGIVIITDGIVGLPDASMFESLMSQLRHSTIECSFIKIGGEGHRQAGLGHIPYKELMQFMAMATFGAYFNKLPPQVSFCFSIFERWNVFFSKKI